MSNLNLRFGYPERRNNDRLFPGISDCGVACTTGSLVDEFANARAVMAAQRGSLRGQSAPLDPGRLLPRWPDHQTIPESVGASQQRRSGTTKFGTTTRASPQSSFGAALQAEASRLARPQARSVRRASASAARGTRCGSPTSWRAAAAAHAACTSMPPRCWQQRPSAVRRSRWGCRPFRNPSPDRRCP
jgi:hypothetical protein